VDPKLQYPHSPRGDHVDDCHGRQIGDPYRWLEDLDSEDTRRWISAQNEVTESFLSAVDGREALRKRVTALWDFERFGAPFKAGGRYFYFRNSGLENQSVLYTMASLDDTPTVLLDPNALSDDGTVALSVLEPSRDGQLLAYSLSEAGSDWQEIRIRNVETGADLDDRLERVKFSAISWTSDGEGFFYSRYDIPAGSDAFAGTNYFQKLYFHRIGTPQNLDLLVFENPAQKEWGFTGEVSEDGRYLIIHVRQGTETRNRVYYQELPGKSVVGGAQTFRLLDLFDAGYEFVGNDDRWFWFLTDLAAPQGRLIAINIDRPDPESWEELVAEGNRTIETVTPVPDGFVIRSLEDAQSRLDCTDRDGRNLRALPLPGIGTVSEFHGRCDDGEAFYAFTGFTCPPTIYRLEVASGFGEVFRKPVVPISEVDYETKQVFYPSPDGTQIPMFIVHRRGLVREGNTPTLLYGYGGFNVSVTPDFAVSRIAWLEMGGVYAVANIRGGGEYGDRWHRSGVGRSKQNGIDDFISGAEWLIDQGYTSTERLAINGGSNGGMLVGTCLNQRPDLFAAAVPAVGVMDLLRFHKFTIGWAWTSDYGSPDDPDDFPHLLALSPYHNLREGTRYPATLVTTGDHDDRVVPSHSFKFTAALQHAQRGAEPTLIRIGVSAGHGAGKPTSKLIDEATDVLSFLKAAVVDPK
jgi:prolyl oligopeptidase